jgi:hypothetical protein
MASPQIDASKIFEQGDCFYQTLAILCNVDPDDVQLGVTIGESAMVIGALTIELFFKCLVRIETGAVPWGHNLKQLYDALSPATRARIQQTWDTIFSYTGSASGTDMKRRLDGKSPAIFRPLSRLQAKLSSAFATATKATPRTCNISYRTFRNFSGASFWN